MSRSDIRVQQRGLDTQQVAMQQLVEQIQQLFKSLSLNTTGSQQRLPPSRYSNPQRSMLELQRIWPLSCELSKVQVT